MILQSWRSEVQNESWGKVKVLVGLISYGGSERRIHFLAFFSFKWLPTCLDSRSLSCFCLCISYRLFDLLPPSYKDPYDYTRFTWIIHDTVSSQDS